MRGPEKEEEEEEEKAFLAFVAMRRERERERCMDEFFATRREIKAWIVAERIPFSPLVCSS